MVSILGLKMCTSVGPAQKVAGTMKRKGTLKQDRRWGGSENVYQTDLTEAHGRADSPEQSEGALGASKTFFVKGNVDGAF
jgi:hypothetical protein